MANLSFDYETLSISRQGSVTTVAFNRPAKKNAMNPTLHREMAHALDALAYDDDTRVLVVTGTGDSFCAGMDLKEVFYALNDDRHEFEKVSRAAEWRSHALRLFPKPTIAAVNGWCFGGAFTIVASCDIVVAAEEATFGLSEINFGKIAGGYVSKAISDILNPRHALYYILTGESFDGREAARINLATMAVPKAELQGKVDEIASTLAEKNPIVARASKEAFKHVLNMDYEQAGAWLDAKSQALDYASGTTWRRGVEQFDEGEYKPGVGHYDWNK